MHEVLQVACLLLPLCFLYDVFWVFIQPLLTDGPSVMVKVTLYSCFTTMTFIFLSSK